MSIPQLETLAIGDELLTGRTSDSNTTFVGDQLFKKGLRLSRVTVIPDDLPLIQQTLKECSGRARYVVAFGGLGPTSDDKTAQAVAELLGCELCVDEPSKIRLLENYGKRKRPISDQALKQVLYPQASTALANPCGMAPGFATDIGQCRFFFLPGVPNEMKAIFLASVLPELEPLAGAIRSHTWQLIGIPESEVQRLMDPVEASLPSVAWLGYRTRPPENHLTLYYRNADEVGFLAFQNRITELVRPFCFSERPVELEELVGERLKASGARIALAESCTGGLVAQRLTRVPGASDYVWGGYMVYQRAAKLGMLGVNLPLELATVSRDCTRRLAESTLEHAGKEVEVAAAITGYMGPSGGTEADPVGTIYLAVVSQSGKVSERRLSQFARSRWEAQWSASGHLLNLILQHLAERD